MDVMRKAEIWEWESERAWMEIRTKLPLLLVSECEAVISFEAQSFELHKGSVLLLRENISAVIRRENKESKVLKVISFECYRLVEHTEETLVYMRSHDKLPEVGYVADQLSPKGWQLFQKLMNPANRMEQAEKDWVLGELLRQVLQRIEIRRDFSTGETMQEAVRYINEHFHTPLTRASMAQMAGFHEGTFSRLFQKYIGRSFTEHVTKVRINKAKEYLCTEALTLNDISQRIGYSDGLYLSRKFKQTVGLSPNAFRAAPKPQRIAAIQFTGHLLALGVKPVAASQVPWETSQLLRDELVGTLNLENGEEWGRLHELNIDLVLAPQYIFHSRGRLERYEQIGPVMTLPWDKLDRLEELRLVGRIIGREEEAEQWIGRYHEQVEAGKGRLSGLIESGETVGLYELRGEDRVWIWNVTSRGTYNLYSALQLTPPERIRQEVLKPGEHLEIILEDLPDYTADHMFVVVDGLSGGYTAENLLEEYPTWEIATRGSRRRIYPLALEEFWCSDGLALERQLQIQVDWLTGE
ncbi:helix-turn-helix domain-containing protein [Paenibacillus sp. NPDC058177]|uniref:helix-turn-helix domain-containing protein n=1 Tax=Paenibacillus sp. NPDC058177 TaxID=3346369 RepID=UPI0036D7C5C3